MRKNELGFVDSEAEHARFGEETVSQFVLRGYFKCGFPYTVSLLDVIDCSM